MQTPHDGDRRTPSVSSRFGSKLPLPLYADVRLHIPMTHRNDVIRYKDSILQGERGINIKPSVGRGGYIQDLTFENIQTKSTSFGVGGDGVPLMPGNNYVPLVSNVHFINVTHLKQSSKFPACSDCNQSKCYNLTVDGIAGAWPDPLPPQTFTCKTTAATMFGKVALPWGVCLPTNAPVNVDPGYPNWGPTTGSYPTLGECIAACKL